MIQALLSRARKFFLGSSSPVGLYRKQAPTSSAMEKLFFLK
jgi:hypothetical protein